MKSDGIITAKNGVVSPPSRGAWIEMVSSCLLLMSSRSPPSRGGAD